MRGKRLGWWAVMIGLLLMAVYPALADEVRVKAYQTTRVRSGPGTDYSIINILLEGDEVTATGRESTANEWLRIDLDGTEGWVAASVVNIDGDPTTLDVVGASNAEATVGQTGVTATIVGAVNVRVGPGTSYRVVTQAEDGTEYDITGRSEIDTPLVCRRNVIIDVTNGDGADDVWLRINFNGFNGWVAYAAVVVAGNLCDVETSTATTADDIPEEVEALLGGVLVVTQDNVNLRASNYAQAEVIEVIPYDKTLEADARTEDSARIRVTYGGETGWIAVSLVEVVRGNIDNLPVGEE